MSNTDLRKLRKQNLDEAKKKIRESVNEDNLINQAINSIDESDRVAAMLSKRLREWYSLYLPEFSHSVSNNEKFTELILRKSKKQLMKEMSISESMGKDIKEENLKAIMVLANQLRSIYEYRTITEKYLNTLMKYYCPNLNELAGTTIAARLIEHTGSLKRLVMMPASTLQILGAEKALFRHIKTGARPPKFGLIHDHQFILQAKRSDQGKHARALADKLLLAAKLDYFKGAFKAKEMKKELEDKFMKQSDKKIKTK